MGKLTGKVALVTGAGQGIGRGIALHFAREGADIIVDDINVNTMEKTASEIRDLGRQAIAVKADVSIKKEVDSLVAAALKAFKRIDILVNNAGIIRRAEFLDMPEQDWDDVINVDLKSVFLCSQAVARHMAAQKYGKIVNISSVTGLGAGEPDSTSYAAAKAGVVNLTKATAKSLGKYGINVNSIAPGTIMTEILIGRRTPAELEDHLKKRKTMTLLGKVGAVDDIARLAVFLASDESSYMTGQVIPCDGGRCDKL